jgi:3-hydroxyisobutyrate dehydrogenase
MAAIGFIGLGAMGRHMAASLQRAGHELRVHDLRREAATEHLAAGARWAESPAAAAQDVDVLFTSLPGPPDVQAVAGAVRDVLRPGTAWFDLTTNSPDIVRRLHASLIATRRSPARCSGQRRAERRAERQARAVGRRRAADLPAGTWPLLQAIGDQPLYVGRSAPARSPSSCTTAPASQCRRSSPK